MGEQKKYKTCNRIYITISFFTDVNTDGETNEYYYVMYLPGTKDFYTEEAVRQGGFVQKYCFKHTKRHTLDDLKTHMLELYKEAKVDDIDLGIVNDGIDVRDMLANHSVEFSGMIFMNTNGYVSRNRSINDEETNEIFQFLLKNIHPDEDEKTTPEVEETEKDFFETDNGLDTKYSAISKGEYTSVCSIERAREYAKIKVDEALNLVKSGTTLLEDGHDVGIELILPSYDSSPNERYVTINPLSVDKLKEYIKY